MDEVREFVTGRRRQPGAGRVLATVLFTDLVDSTAQAARLGDGRWRSVLDDHDFIARRIVTGHGGTLVKATGDGIRRGSTARLAARNSLRRPVA